MMLATVIEPGVLERALAGRDVAQVVSILDRAALEPRPSAEVLAQQLAHLGPDALPDLFLVLSTGGAAEHRTSALEEEALVASLASFGAPPLRVFLNKRLNANPPAEEREAALRVLERFATAADLPLLRDSASGPGSGLEGALQASGAALLRRDGSALEPLRRWMLEAPDNIAEALVHATGDSQCARALPTLAAALGYHPRLDPILLEEIGRLVATAPKPIDAEILGPLLEALAQEDV